MVNITDLRRQGINIASGTLAGIAGCIVGHPFDTLKVRLQTQSVHKPIYKGVTDCFFKTLKWEGIGGLYKGVGSPIVGQMFFRAALFTSYYEISNFISGPERVGKRLHHYEYFICGGFTGCVSALFEGPVDVFKTQMQIQIMRAKSGADVQYRNVFHAGYVIIKQHGIRSIYQGLSATWLRNIPSTACYFGFYELFRDKFTPPGGKVTDIPMWASFVSGGTAGFLYWFFTYPADVIKSAMQSDNPDKKNRRFRGIIDCAGKLYKDEGGWRRFYKGFAPCLMRSIPANATMFIVVDQCRKFFNQH